MRISTGIVKLRRAHNVLSLTIPKTVAINLKESVDSEYFCQLLENGSIVFSPVEEDNEMPGYRGDEDDLDAFLAEMESRKYEPEPRRKLMVKGT